MYDEIAERVYVAMKQAIEGNGNCDAARKIGGEIIRAALTARAWVDFSEAWANRDYWLDKPSDKAAAEYWFDVGAGKLIPSRSILPAIAAAKDGS